MDQTQQVLISCSLGRYGGVETHVYWLARLLRESGTAVTIAARSCALEPSWLSRLTRAGVRMVTTPLPWWRRAPHLRNLWALATWPGALDGMAFDTLFAAGSGSFHLWMRRFLRPGGWAIYNEVLGVPPYQQGRVRPRYLQLLRGMDAVIVYAPSIATTLRRSVGGSTPVRVLPPLHGHPRARPSLKPPNVRERPLRIAYVGRMIAGKQPALLLACWPALRSALQPASLDFYGDGPEVAPLQQLVAANGWENEVAVGGRYNQATDLDTIFAAVDLLVLPASGGEGLPLVVLEAMARGVPAVVTAVGGLRDLAALDPEVSVVAPRPDAVQSAIIRTGQQLRRGELDRQRLVTRYQHRLSDAANAPQWRAALLTPEQFWQSPADEPG